MDIVKFIFSAIERKYASKPMLIAFDGVDTSGKTSLADRVARYMAASGEYHPTRVSIDKFHNPKNIRLSRGDLSPEGFYYDSFDYGKLIDCVFNPIKSGEPEIRTGIFDYKSDSIVENAEAAIDDRSIVLFDGIFLQRAELRHFWDLSIFLDITFEEVMKRAIRRDTAYLGSISEVEKRYSERYIPGEKLYFELVRPREKADIVIDNNDYENPIVIRDGTTDSAKIHDNPE